MDRQRFHDICQYGGSAIGAQANVMSSKASAPKPVVANPCSSRPPMYRPSEARRWRFVGGEVMFAAAGRQADLALDTLDLTAIADHPAGLLSHGDQRLLEVAMALVQEPRLLLLDEPIQGLSVEETTKAVETLAALLAASRMTVLLVEHDIEVVFRLAHRITVLHRGAVIADDTPAAVRQDAEVQSANLGGLA
jgi:branched-chain amino acid transport system ATP-binding protein